jgi:acyl-CoA dehydrogenase
MHQNPTLVKPCLTVNDADALDHTATIIEDSVTRLLQDHADQWLPTAPVRWLPTTWTALEDMGLPRMLLDEGSGGFGLTTLQALKVVRLAGAAAMPLPLGEAMLGTWLLARAGIEIPSGALSVGLCSTLNVASGAGSFHLTGSAARIPWGQAVDWIVLLAELADQTGVFLVASNSLIWGTGRNLAGEARDSLQIDLRVSRVQAGVIPRLDRLAQQSLGAALRCQSIAGSLEHVLQMTLQYAQDRVQFGRPIGSFQVIQHNLAIMAGQVVAAGAAADLAAESFGAADPLPVAISKVRCGEAAGVVAPLAHQIHGALGFTAEHSLHRYSKRLWAWREEYGGEPYWSEIIGNAALQAVPEGLWPMLTAV